MDNKLLFFASDYQIGLSFLLTEELKGLVRQPELEVLAISGETEQTKGLFLQIEENQIPIFIVDGLDVHKKFLKLARQIYLIIYNSKCSFVHVQNNWQLALIVFIKYFYNVDYKIIYTIHGYRHNNFFKAIVAKRIIDMALFCFANIVFTASTDVKQKFWLIKKKCYVLYLGVEENYFNTPEPAYFSIHKNIIFAGQFRHGKNQGLILEALSKYIERSGDKDFTLYLPGEGALKENCVKLSHYLKLKDNVIFPGQLSREDVLKLYSRCQIAIVPTNSETFGHCIAEPFVMGLCVMTRNIGIAKDVILNGKNGLIFRDSHDLSILLEKYLTNNDTIATIGNSAYSKRELFRWSSICRKYKEIIEAYTKNKSVNYDDQKTVINLLYFASDYRIGLSSTLSEQARSIFNLNCVNPFCIGGDKEQEVGLSLKYERLNIPLNRIKGLDEHKNFFHLVEEIIKLITQNKVKVVHLHNNWQLALIVFIKIFYSHELKIIYSIHGYRHNNYIKAFFAKKIIGFSLYLFADLVLAGSNELKNAIPFISKKCQLLMQGVEEDLFLGGHLIKFNKHKNIVFAGQFRNGKNQKKLMNTLRKYTEQTGERNYTLFLPGEGILWQSCIKFAFKSGLAKNVVFPGQLTRNQIKELYKQCQIAIIPSNNETFGYCIAEPYITGLCVISRKTGIALDIIEHEKSGLLFDSFSDLKDLLVKYLSDEKQLEIMSNKSFENRDILRWANITQKYEVLLRKLVS